MADKVKKKFRTFWNDDEGLTAKDFLMTSSFVMFALFWMIGTSMELLGHEVSEGYHTLMKQIINILEPIIYGTFAVTGVKMGADAYSKKKETVVYAGDDPVADEPYIERDES